MISIILTCGKHLHDHIISRGGEVWAHKTSLIHHCSSIEVTRGFDFTETLCVQNHVQCTCTKNIGVVARVKCLVRFPFLSFF